MSWRSRPSGRGLGPEDRLHILEAIERDEETAGSGLPNCARALDGLQDAGDVPVPLTRGFKETAQARIRRDRNYRRELLREGVQFLLAGRVDTGKAILRDYINGTIRFEELSRATKRPTTSLMRMFERDGNPQARDRLEVIGQLARVDGLQFELSLKVARQKSRVRPPAS